MSEHDVSFPAMGSEMRLLHGGHLAGRPRQRRVVPGPYLERQEGEDREERGER